MVIEEKRPLLEDQIRSILYGGANAPSIVGKYFDGATFDPAHGALAIPNFGETTPELVAAVLVKALRRHNPDCALSAPEAPAKTLSNRPAPVRSPGFCAGCPHNRSTRVPEGSRALGGIGCHTMAMLVNPMQTTTVSHMGGEGAMWLGQQPFTRQQHVFANLGDGTYAHSGVLAVRQAVAANVPITYKILYNGFVSMTGGQPIEGGMTPVADPRRTRRRGGQEAGARGRRPGPLSWRSAAAPASTLRHRDAMDETQREFREFKGVSAILYDQPCADRAATAAQARQMGRPRHPHLHPPAKSAKAAAIAEKSPIAWRSSRSRPSSAASAASTSRAATRTIPASMASARASSPCTAESCASLRLTAPRELPAVPEPALPEIGERYNVLVPGIGGAGVVTVSQTLAVAAYLDGLYSSNLDLTGLSQKYGAVTAHVRMAREARGPACDPHRRRAKRTL